jgi:acyl-CoA reductase-like NAD-dependent aldehyde dehydrogenase
MLTISNELEWSALIDSARQAVPEAWSPHGDVLNLFEGKWQGPGNGKHYVSPVDGRQLGRIPMLDLPSAMRAVRFAADEFEPWARTPLAERQRRVASAVAALRRHRLLLARLLVWEIGKTYKTAQSDVDRCIDGVDWYVGQIGEMLTGRTPIGLVSNIASWNYPMSVLMHALLVQLLAGNSVIAKTPTDGGLYTLTVACGLARREGLPISLLSGSGSALSDALVRSPQVACLSFVGGKTNGREIASRFDERNKRYLLEMEGMNAYGIWNFSDWPALAAQLRKAFDYGKQRCTAYTRFVIQRQLFPRFLEMYLPLLAALRIGNPTLGSDPQAPPPELDFGPLINAAKTEELRLWQAEALDKGAVALYEGSLDPAAFLPNQDNSAYAAPVALLGVPRSSRLYHNEPFGPIDSLVVVDRVEELVAEMNASNGSLVASLACDDSKAARAIGGELRAFKVGYNRVRSRGDRDEVFGGIGNSWKGCFAGGKYLVDAVTNGPPGAPLYGNFVASALLPEVR